jgi:hypothetical protein
VANKRSAGSRSANAQQAANQAYDALIAKHRAISWNDEERPALSYPNRRPAASHQATIRSKIDAVFLAGEASDYDFDEILKSDKPERLRALYELAKNAGLKYPTAQSIIGKAMVVGTPLLQAFLTRLAEAENHPEWHPLAEQDPKEIIDDLKLPTVELNKKYFGDDSSAGLVQRHIAERAQKLLLPSVWVKLNAKLSGSKRLIPFVEDYVALAEFADYWGIPLEKFQEGFVAIYITDATRAARLEEIRRRIPAWHPDFVKMAADANEALRSDQIEKIVQANAGDYDQLVLRIIYHLNRLNDKSQKFNANRAAYIPSVPMVVTAMSVFTFVAISGVALAYIAYRLYKNPAVAAWVTRTWNARWGSEKRNALRAYQSIVADQENFSLEERLAASGVVHATAVQELFEAVPSVESRHLEELNEDLVSLVEGSNAISNLQGDPAFASALDAQRQDSSFTPLVYGLMKNPKMAKVKTAEVRKDLLRIRLADATRPLANEVEATLKNFDSNNSYAVVLVPMSTSPDEVAAARQRFKDRPVILISEDSFATLSLAEIRALIKNPAWTPSAADIRVSRHTRLGEQALAQLGKWEKGEMGVSSVQIQVFDILAGNIFSQPVDVKMLTEMMAFQQKVLTLIAQQA